MKTALRAIALAIAAIVAPSTARAQVVVDCKLDRAEILIGEQAQLTTTVTAGAKSRVELPTFASGDTLTAGVEVLGCSAIDTTALDEGRLLRLTRAYTITSFDSALYALPPMQVRVDDSVYTSRARLGLKVGTVPVDTVHVDQFAPAFTVVEAPYTWNWSPLLCAVAPWLLLPLLLWMGVRLSDRRPIVRRVRVKPPVPPFQLAWQQLGALTADAPATDKDFYTALTDTLRLYLQGRYGVNARENTTAEIMESLMDQLAEPQARTLGDVLAQADAVKYAKATTSAMERERSLASAADFLNSTRDLAQEQVSPKVRIVVLSGRKQRALRIVLLVAFGVTAVSLLAALYVVAKHVVETYL